MREKMLGRENKSFDPEGDSYDYLSAFMYRITPDSSGHYPSRVPSTGLLLKGRKHPTWHKTVEAEEKMGYEIIKIGNRYYSFPKEQIFRWKILEMLKSFKPNVK